MRARLLGALGVSVAALWACGLVETRKLADAFNQGVLDSNADPFYDRSQRAKDTVMWRMRDELGDGYFGQGDHNAHVVAWLAKLHKDARPVMEQMLANAFSPDGGADFSLSDDAGADDGKPAPAAQRAVQKTLDSSLGIRPPEGPLCKGKNLETNVAEELADYVRFSVALRNAIDVTAKLVDERFATRDEAIDGASRAFEQTSKYLENRKWRRDTKHRTTGLVVKGGAATGIFSAGVVWATLSLIDQCKREGKCDDKTAFAMASGTSTGATVVAATDVYHTAITNDGARKDALRHYLDWYLCSSMNDLYCVRNHSDFNLVRGSGGKPKDIQDGVLDFGGIASKVESAYHCAEMSNGMELVLNTTDFRTGRLYSLSDQDPATIRAPWDVAMAVVSSAALPFIVRPVYHLPVDPMQDAGVFSYLDGGIRSELPMLALVRRGVERLVVVSSDSSITGDEHEITNALDMAIRYIDIETGSVTESEIDHARTRAVSSRLAEYEYCNVILRADRATAPKQKQLCPINSDCDPDRFCSGDFARACSYVPGRPLQNNEQIVRQTFQVTNVWRNTDRVPALHGYSFNPTQQRRLMLAGAEAARNQCVQIAAALGIEGVDDETLHRWCTPRLPQVEEQCPSDVLERLKKSPNAPNCPSDDLGPQPSPDAGSGAACGRTP